MSVTFLRSDFEAISELADHLSIKGYDRAGHGRILRAYHRAFSAVLRARGLHVHKNDFEPRELSWIGTLELLSKVGGESPWLTLLPTAIRQARERWLRLHVDAKHAMTEFLNISVRQTKPVWSKLKDRLNDV
jgi:hypothetical protein